MFHSPAIAPHSATAQPSWADHHDALARLQRSYPTESEAYYYAQGLMAQLDATWAEAALRIVPVAGGFAVLLDAQCALHALKETGQPVSFVAVRGARKQGALHVCGTWQAQMVTKQLKQAPTGRGPRGLAAQHLLRMAVLRELLGVPQLLTTEEDKYLRQGAPAELVPPPVPGPGQLRPLAETLPAGLLALRTCTSYAALQSCLEAQPRPVRANPAFREAYLQQARKLRRRRVAA